MNKLAMIAVIGALALIISSGAIVLGTNGRIPINGDDESGHAGDAKVTADEAKAAAEEHTGGTATAVELENEDGYLVYGVTIMDGSGMTHDVKVDAGTGEVLKVEDGDDGGPESADEGEPGEASDGEPEDAGVDEPEDDDDGPDSEHEFDGEEEGEH